MLLNFPAPLEGSQTLASTAPVSEIASRYARALFDLADEQDLLDDIASDLAQLMAMVEQSSDLQRLLRSPILGRDEQGQAMAGILEAMEANPLTRRFVGLIARNRRLFVLTDIIRGYLDELARRRGEITAEVTAPKALSESQTTALRDALQRKLGGTVTIDASIDPSMIGGLIVKIGSQMINTSLRTQLNKMQLAMRGTS
jgi:F-type H+-transporting ATPase subunit delta